MSSQNALIDMLLQMLEQKNMSGVVFVTHDLPVLRTVSNRFAIMYVGKIVEVGDAAEITETATALVRAALLSAVLCPSRTTGRCGSTAFPARGRT